jgi:peptidylprolyl isomerase
VNPGTRRPRRALVSTLLFGALAVLAVPLLAACSAGNAPDGTRAAPVDATTLGASQFSLARLPKVSGATVLTGKPGLSAGTGAPPAALVTRDLVVGTGETAAPASTVAVQYVGALWNGQEFDSSWNNGQPSEFDLSGGIIPGFAQGIAGMRVGGRREIAIPPELAYRSQGSGPIPPNASLVFVVDLLAVRPAEQ